MSPHVHSLITWGPRVAGVVVVGFLSLFALDAFDGRPIADVLPDFAMHLLPAAIVAFVVVLAWRFPWVGAVGFAVLAAGYAAMVPTRPDWILAISGALVAVAMLFALGALARRASPELRS